jgi:HEAT repeat protein
VRRILPLVLLVASVWVAPAAGQEARERKYRGRPLKFWLGQLQAQKAEDRNLAFTAVTAFGAEGKAAAVPVLVEMLDDLCPEFQVFAAESLGKSAPLPKPAVAALIRTLQRSEDAGARRALIDALVQLGSQADAAVTVLARFLRDEDWTTAFKVANVLARMGPAARAAAPALETGSTKGLAVEGAGHLQLGFRHHLLRTLAKIGPEGVPVLGRLLRRNPEMRATIAAVLGDMGSKAKAAVPALIESLADKRGDVRAEIAWALWRVAGHKAAIPILAESLRTEFPNVQEGLEHPGPGKMPGMPVPTLSGKMPGMPVPTLSGGQLFPGGEPFEPIARRIDGHASILDGLAEIGPQAKIAIPELEQILANRMRPHRERAAWALWKIAKHRKAVPVLAEHVEGMFAPMPRVVAAPRGPILEWLEEIGPEAREAIPALTKALEGSEGATRERLLRVLRKIDPKAVPAAPR